MGDLAPSNLAGSAAAGECIYDYHNADGDLLYQVVRQPGKRFRQRRPDGQGGWLWNLRGVGRVLYRLPQLIAAVHTGTTIYIVEGEKDVHAAESVGVVATTNSGGAGKWRDQDSAHLQGADVVIVADRDQAGRQHALAVASSLHGKAARVRVVASAAGNDLSDHLAAGHGIEDLVPLDGPTENRLELIWKPFPTHRLPEPLRSFVAEVAVALGCDEAFIAIPLLAVLAGCIGNRAVLELKRTWRVPAVLWAAIVAESGTLKSPALDILLRPLREREARRNRSHREALVLFERDEKARRDKPKGERGDPLDPPKEPERLVLSDTTTEAAALRLDSSPLGLLLHADELAAWLKSFDVYRGGASGPDAERWLTSYDARGWIVDRVGKPSIVIPSAAISIVGAIQPAVLKRVLGQQHFDNGLAARILLGAPPRSPKVWNEAVPSESVLNDYTSILQRLLESGPDQGLDDGALRPRILLLSPEAKELWTAWYDEHGVRQNEAEGYEASLLSKIEGTAARIALVLHLVRVAAGDETADPQIVDEVSLRAGTGLADWFADEGLRLYAILDETAEDRQRRELIELLQSRFPEGLTARQLRDARRCYRAPGQAQEALDALVRAGQGRWEQRPPGPSGGRPTEVFVPTLPDVSVQSGNAVQPQLLVGLRGGSSSATEDLRTPVDGARSGNSEDPAVPEGFRTGPGTAGRIESPDLRPHGKSRARTSGVPAPEVATPSSLSGDDPISRAERCLWAAIRSGVERDIRVCSISLGQLVGTQAASEIEMELRLAARREATDAA